MNTIKSIRIIERKNPIMNENLVEKINKNELFSFSKQSSLKEVSSITP